MVQEAARGIQSGIRIGLDMPLDTLVHPAQHRQGLKHSITRRKGYFDDDVAFNAQVCPAPTPLAVGRDIDDDILFADLFAVGRPPSLWVPEAETIF